MLPIFHFWKRDRALGVKGISSSATWPELTHPTLICLDHVSESKNDFPKPIWNTLKVVRVTLLIPHHNCTKKLPYVKKPHKLRELYGTLSSSHLIGIIVPMVWPTKARSKTQKSAVKKRGLRTFMIISAQWLCILLYKMINLKWKCSQRFSWMSFIWIVMPYK